MKNKQDIWNVPGQLKLKTVQRLDKIKHGICWSLFTHQCSRLCSKGRECSLPDLVAIAASTQWIISERLSLEETIEGHWVQIPCSSKATCSQLSRTISRHTQCIYKEGSCKIPGQPVPVVPEPHSKLWTCIHTDKQYFLVPSFIAAVERWKKLHPSKSINYLKYSMLPQDPVHPV